MLSDKSGILWGDSVCYQSNLVFCGVIQYVMDKSGILWGGSVCYQTNLVFYGVIQYVISQICYFMG